MIKIMAIVLSFVILFGENDLYILKNVKAADQEIIMPVTPTEADVATVALMPEDNQIAFMLNKAVYTPKSGDGVALGTTTGNNVSANYELIGLDADGKNIDCQRL